MEEFLQHVKAVYASFDASHDFDHIERVMQNAEAILQTEPTADAELIRYAVLLHDVSDKKYSESKEAEERLIAMLELSEAREAKLRHIIEAVSFNGGNEIATTMLEAKVVRDADRLDAIGAVGIARTFAFGGAKGRKLYDTTEEVRENMTEAEYRSRNSASVTHFYEKLLKLKDLMTTKKGQELAQARHAFMEQFLHQLQMERDGKA